MKKCLLGIGIILFTIVIALCSNGMELIILICGIIGLVILISGYLSKSE